MQRKDLKRFCCWTMATTNGLLVPAKVLKRINSKHTQSVFIFGFQNERNARFAEIYGDMFINSLCNVILGNMDLILFFGLDQILLKDDLKKEQKSRSNATQTTQSAIGNKVPASQWIQHTWNIWDYHRETMRLANLRHKQTHSTQTDLSYGKRSVATQLN